MRHARPYSLAFICFFAPLWAEAQTTSPFSVIPASKQVVNTCRADGSDVANSGTAGSTGCSPAAAAKKLPIRVVRFRDPKQMGVPDALVNASSPGPSGAHLTYDGGPVISNAQVVVVYWNNNVSPTVTNGIVNFYQTVVDSTYLDLLYEYSTVGLNYNGTTTNQKVGHGTVVGPYTITPSVTQNAIDDTQIQSELQQQIAGGHLPPVSTDDGGLANTLYAIYFPPGIKITQGGASSCQAGGFCAYHGSANTSGTSPQAFQYSVIPDFGTGSGCDAGCGGGTEFQNVTSVSSHELAESITDAQVGFASNYGPPLAWYDNANGEVGDICDGKQDTISAHGQTFTIQQLWSNNQGACVNGPGASLSLATTATSATTGTSLPVTVTVKNSKGVTLPFYSGTIHFTSSDTAAQLPADYAFVASDGGSHTFNVSFGGSGSQSVTATDVDVASITGSLSVSVAQGQQTPVISWTTPAAITYGTPLGAAQLNATANVPGTFAYSPAAGTVLVAGMQQLRVIFTPSDAATYKTATASVMLQVSQATPSITWATPGAITYGTALSAAQLNAATAVPGNFAYSPALGTVLTAGQQKLKVIFTPNDGADYNTAAATVTLQVNQAAPTITWATPAPVTYGTPLGAAQLNAAATVPGNFVFTPAAGTVLPAGQQTLKVTFTPTDGTDYATATATVTLQVNQVTPTINWATPAPVTYGTPLGAAQLDATANVAGTFVYTPGAGTVLASGNQQLSVAFTPADTVDYKSASATVTLQVSAPQFTLKAQPAVETVYRGQLAAFLLVLKAENGFNGNVALICAGGPPNSVCGDFPKTINLHSQALAVSGVVFPSTTVPGVYTVTFTAQSQLSTAKASATFDVR